MLEVRGLSAHYGRIQALRDINLTVSRGEIVAVIGANGAGKSTLLNCIAGLVRPTEGEIRFCGQPIHRVAPDLIVRRGLSLVPERRQLFDSLTVRENMMLGAFHRHRSRTDRKQILHDLERICDFLPVLRQREKQLAGTLSGGEQQMVAIGRALMAAPALLMCDEPSLGLAPLIIRDITRILGDLRTGGTTILLIEQNARAAFRVADRVCVMERGVMVLQGSVVELLRDDRVRHAYLGGRPATAGPPPPEVLPVV